jgi:hypothetical protein
LEEAAFFGEDEKGYKVNAEDLLKAGEPRLLKGGQGWIISSANGRQGLVYDLWEQHFGKPGRILVVRAPTLVMNPAFDRAEYDALKARNPDAAASEYDVEWLDVESSMLPMADIERAMRPPQARLPRYQYVAAMDPATRGNAWTLAIATKVDHDHVRIVYTRQWVGSRQKPLSPLEVLKEMAPILHSYGINSVATDQYASDALKDLARPLNVFVWEVPSTQQTNFEMFEDVRVWLREGRLEITDDPQVKTDLAGIKKRVGRLGVSIELTKTPDGRHCDYAPSIARALYVGALEPGRPRKEKPRVGTNAWAAEEKERALAAAERAARESRPPWWTDAHERFYQGD